MDFGLDWIGRHGHHCWQVTAVVYESVRGSCCFFCVVRTVGIGPGELGGKVCLVSSKGAFAFL